MSQHEIERLERQRGRRMCAEAHERNACNVTPSCLLNTCATPFLCQYDTISYGIKQYLFEHCRCQWVGSNISRRCEPYPPPYTDFCQPGSYNELGRWEPDDENCSCEACNTVVSEPAGRLFTHSGYAQTARIVTGEDDDWSFGPKASPDLGKAISFRVWPSMLLYLRLNCFMDFFWGALKGQCSNFFCRRSKEFV